MLFIMNRESEIWKEYSFDERPKILNKNPVFSFFIPQKFWTRRWRKRIKREQEEREGEEDSHTDTYRPCDDTYRHMSGVSTHTQACTRRPATL